MARASRLATAQRFAAASLDQNTHSIGSLSSERLRRKSGAVVRQKRSLAPGRKADSRVPPWVAAFDHCEPISLAKPRLSD